MLIVGGTGGDKKQVQVISPTNGTIEDCAILPLPEGRWGHTINKGTVCGGGGSSTRSSCVRVQPDGGWIQTITLKQPRLTRIFCFLTASNNKPSVYLCHHSQSPFDDTNTEQVISLQLLHRGWNSDTGWYLLLLHSRVHRNLRLEH